MVPPQRPHRGRGHLPRRLPPGPRPGHHGRPAAAVAKIPGPGAARPARDGHLLRLGRHLQPQRSRTCPTGWPRRKIENILSTGAQIVLAANAGCLLQIQREVRQRKLPLAGDAPDGPARPELPRRTARVAVIVGGHPSRRLPRNGERSSATGDAYGQFYPARCEKLPISSATSRSISSRGVCGRRSGSLAIICRTN